MNSSGQNSVQEILLKINGLREPDALRILSDQFRDQTVFSTSFSSEDQVITDMIASGRLAVKIFTLDTGRLFPETYSTWTRTLEKYRQRIIAYLASS